jgi:hypothetical protein
MDVEAKKKIICDFLEFVGSQHDVYLSYKTVMNYTRQRVAISKDRENQLIDEYMGGNNWISK